MEKKEKEKRMRFFRRGDNVETVNKKEPGFKDSFYQAVIISQLNKPPPPPPRHHHQEDEDEDEEEEEEARYIVEYRTLQTEADESKWYGVAGPLREFRSHSELRPLPPVVPVSEEFKVNDKVDAYYNDGWWSGDIISVQHSQYHVLFRHTGDVIPFSFDQLRLTQLWLPDTHTWVFPKKRGRPRKK